MLLIEGCCSSSLALDGFGEFYEISSTNSSWGFVIGIISSLAFGFVPLWFRYFQVCIEELGVLSVVQMFSNNATILELDVKCQRASHLYNRSWKPFLTTLKIPD